MSKTGKTWKTTSKHSRDPSHRQQESGFSCAFHPAYHGLPVNPLAHGDGGISGILFFRRNRIDRFDTLEEHVAPSFFLDIDGNFSEVTNAAFSR